MSESARRWLYLAAGLSIGALILCAILTVRANSANRLCRMENLVHEDRLNHLAEELWDLQHRR